MGNKFIKTFESHRSNKLRNTNEINESVKQIGDVYKVGSIDVKQTLINSYVKRVKDETGKDLRNMYSDMDIASEVVKFIIEEELESDTIPTYALLDGESEDEDLTSDLEDVDTEEEEIITDEDEESEEDDESDEDLDLDNDSDDEFEEAEKSDSDEEDEEEEDEEDDSEDDSEGEELPI